MWKALKDLTKPYANWLEGVYCQRYHEELCIQHQQEDDSGVRSCCSLVLQQKPLLNLVYLIKASLSCSAYPLHWRGMNFGTGSVNSR